VAELLARNLRCYFIPYFQRPYEWEKKHALNLVEDLWSAFTTEENRHYFLGSMVFLETTIKQGAKLWHVIDGQQRLTSLLLLHIAIRIYFNATRNEASQKFVDERIEKLKEHLVDEETNRAGEVTVVGYRLIYESDPNKEENDDDDTMNNHFHSLCMKLNTENDLNEKLKETKNKVHTGRKNKEESNEAAIKHRYVKNIKIFYDFLREVCLFCVLI